LNETVQAIERAKVRNLNENDVSPAQANGRQVSTYASLVDPEEGTALKLVQLNDFHDQKCAKIEKMDI